MGINTEYKLANKLYEMEKEFEELGVNVRYRKKYNGLLPSALEVDKAFDEMVQRFIDYVSQGTYPTIMVKPGVKPLNLIYDTILDKEFSTYIKNKIEQFEKKQSVKLKVNREDKFIYIESDKSKYFFDSVAVALKKITANTEESPT
jgi:hypothetical protein